MRVDGDTHEEVADRARDKALAEQGYRTVRITNRDVMSNIDGVLLFVAEALRQAERPHPNHSTEGEGLQGGEEKKLLGISIWGKIGGESCRERGGQYGSKVVVAGRLKKKYEWKKTS